MTYNWKDTGNIRTGQRGPSEDNLRDTLAFRCTAVNVNLVCLTYQIQPIVGLESKEVLSLQLPRANDSLEKS